MTNETCDFDLNNNNPNLSSNNPNSSSACCSNASCSSNIEKSQQRFQKKIGRNDPCPCGSKKKYKKCCWLV